MAFSGRFIVLLAAMVAVTSASSVRNLRAHEGHSKALVTQSMHAPKWGTSFKKSNTVCLQLDITGWGGAVGLSFSVSGEVEMENVGKPDATVKINAMIGGGFSVSAIIIKGSAYVEGKVGLVIPIGDKITDLKKAAAHGLSFLYDKFKKKTKLGKMIASAKGWFGTLNSKDKGLDKLKKMKADSIDKVDAATADALYTPWACGLPQRGFGADQSPAFLPDDPSCKIHQALAAAKKTNWLVCPSRSRNFQKCSAYCPGGHDDKKKTKTIPVNDPKKDVAALPNCAEWKIEGVSQTEIQRERTMSRVIRHDAREKLDAFRKEMKKKITGMKGLGEAKAACTDENIKKDPAKCRTAYVDNIEKVFRLVYIGTEEVRKDGLVFKDGTKCSKEPVEPLKNPMRPLMCVFMKYGMLIGKGEASSNKNFRDSLRALFPSLVVQTSDAPKDFDYKKSYANAKKLTDAEDMEQVPDEIMDTLDAVSMMLAINNHDMEDRIKAYQTDLTTTTTSEDSEAECKVTKFEGTVTFGLTAGGSTVGFCTPDTNPFQMQKSRDFERTGKWEGGKCVPTWNWSDDWATTYTFAASIFLQVHYKKYKDSLGKAPEITVQLRMPAAGGDFSTPAKPPAADAPLETTMQKLASMFIGVNTQGAPVNKLEVFEGLVKELMYGVVDAVKAPAAGSAIATALSTGFVNVEAMVRGAANKMFNEALDKMLPLKGASETLYGIDLKKEGDKYTVALVYYAYTWFTAEGGLGAAGGAVTGSQASNNEFSVTYDKTKDFDKAAFDKMKTAYAGSQLQKKAKKL
jgi:hypothetical protein